LYVVFRLTRSSIPPSLLRDSLPSLLFPLALLPCLEAAQSLLHTGSSLIRTALCGCVSAVLTEGLAPALGRGTADPADFVAIFAGTALHTLWNYRKEVPTSPKRPEPAP
jgi:hypothetical protein